MVELVTLVELKNISNSHKLFNLYRSNFLEFWINLEDIKLVDDSWQKSLDFALILVESSFWFPWPFENVMTSRDKLAYQQLSTESISLRALEAVIQIDFSFSQSFLFSGHWTISSFYICFHHLSFLNFVAFSIWAGSP
jgi:hypothetical protein